MGFFSVKLKSYLGEKDMLLIDFFLIIMYKLLIKYGKISTPIFPKTYKIIDIDAKWMGRI